MCLQLLASGARDGGSNLGGAESADLVGQRSRGQGTLGGRVDRAAKVDILNNGVTSLLGVGEEDGALGRVGKGGALDEDLGAHAGVDTGEDDAIPVVVDNVDSGEADEGLTAVDVLPVVVGIGDVELASVLRGVAVG